LQGLYEQIRSPEGKEEDFSDNLKGSTLQKRPEPDVLSRLKSKHSTA
jgi:hypothetical protein